MGILSGALGGMGEAMANIGARNQQASLQRENELALNDQRSSLDTQKQMALEKFREGLRTAPLERLGSKAKELSGQEVPVDAPEPVTSTGGILNAGAMKGVDGQPIQMQGGSDKGLVGDIAKIRQQVMNDPSISAEDRAGVLAQLDAQTGQENQANADAVAGKTRKRTTDEALSAAVDDAKINDLPAAAAYEANIGKPKRDERRLDNLERREDTREKKSDAEMEDRRKRSDWLQTHQQEKLDLDREIAKQRAERGGADPKDPSEVAATKWLIANKDDPVAMAMWDKAHLSKSKDLGGMAADFMAKDPMLSAAEAVSKAKELMAATSTLKQAPADTPITQAEYAKLPSGAVFTAPDGSKRRKP